jgi:hypothetical protein
VFEGDMVLPINCVADWGGLNNNTKEMARNNKKENASRINHDCKEGEKVLFKKPGKQIRKLEAQRTGSHTVSTIYTNGIL